MALVAPLAAPCWLKVQRRGSAPTQRGWGGHQAGQMGAGTPLPCPCQACHPLPHPPSTPQLLLHPMHAPPHPLPTQTGILATPHTPSWRFGSWDGPAFVQHLSSGGCSRLLVRAARDARLGREAAAGAGSAAGGAPFPWPFPGNVFLARGGSLTLETPNPLAQGPWVQPPPVPALAPRPIACREVGHAAPEQPG